MPGSYQITQVQRNVDGIRVTVSFLDSVKPGPLVRVYTFAAEPDPVELDTMLKSERVRLFRQVPAAVIPPVTPGGVVNVPADPVVP